jgi:phosphatidylglycerol:prolipoprotein diacylglycerol transferase
VSGIAGARLAYVIADLPEYLKHPLSILRVDQGGLIYYGGFLGATAAVAVFAHRRKEPFLRIADLVATALPLAHALGRLGCFVNGCCYGKPFSGAWGVSYPADSAPWWGQVNARIIPNDWPRSLPVHPVQLYEAAFNVALCALLVFTYQRRNKKDGAVVALYFILYPAWRLWVETLRGDERVQAMGLSVAQDVSLFFMLLGLGLALHLRKRRDAAL